MVKKVYYGVVAVVPISEVAKHYISSLHSLDISLGLHKSLKIFGDCIEQHIIHFMNNVISMLKIFIIFTYYLCVCVCVL